jgi:phage tail sheath gpL-like
VTVPFKITPDTGNRLPLFSFELDPSRANQSTENQRALIIGQKTAAGTIVADTPMLCAGKAEAKALGGPGSLLALMVAAYRLNDDFGEVWYGPVADNGAGAAAAGTLTFAGAPTASGVVSAYICDVLVPIAVTTSDTPTTVATALAAAINANTDLPVTAGSALGVVTVTAKNKGTPGNDLDLRKNFYGAAQGEADVPGLTCVIVAMSGGATNPVLTTLLANLNDEPFDFIVSPYTDATSVAALTALLSDTTGRWSWLTGLYGGVFMAFRGTSSACATFGLAMNDQHASCMGFNDSPTSNFIWAAAYAGASAVSIRSDAPRPLNTLTLRGVRAPPLASRFLASQRNTLLFDGIATWKAASDGSVVIERAVTTYQKNGLGQPDDSYLQVERMYQLMAIIRTMRTALVNKFSRAKLVADGTRIPAGSNCVSPSTIRAELIAQYRLMTPELVQDPDAFAKGLIVEIAADNASRVNVLWDGVLTNGLQQFATLVQFRAAA